MKAMSLAAKQHQIWPHCNNAERLPHLVTIIAADSEVKAAVEDNHDNNRWWPLDVLDWRLRMVFAGWSTRISYSMVTSYAKVVTAANDLGYPALQRMADEELIKLLRPIGLQKARIKYLRSLDRFLDTIAIEGLDPLQTPADKFIARFAANVDQAGYKVAQCATLYARGYHCGLIPVDSGMVTRLAPRLGLSLHSGPIAHEEMRAALEQSVVENADHFRQLITALGYRITLPDNVIPTWWLHLVLIYFKRLYLNRPDPRVCKHVPMCDNVFDCGCAISGKHDLS